MGIKGLGKRGIGVDGLNLDNVKRDFPDLLPAGSIDDLQNTTTYGGFIKVISDLQRESNSRVKMIRDSTFAEIDKKSKEMGLSEEVIRKQKSIVDYSYSNLIRETLDKK